jgi:hypothetical protein
VQLKQFRILLDKSKGKKQVIWAFYHFPDNNKTKMLKNWKSLFVKTEEDIETKDHNPASFSFPVANTDSGKTSSSPAYIPPVAETKDPVVTEVLEIYENGLDSINMPGYDFYEFYKAVSSTIHGNEQIYQMAYQMAKTLDKTITGYKLLNDAEFYISKINEVHSQYVTQGQQKLNEFQEKKNGDKHALQTAIDAAGSRITQLRAELQQLETDISNKRNQLSKIEESFYPQEKSIREKLNANDLARNTSIDKLNLVKQRIQQFIKD